MKAVNRDETRIRATTARLLAIAGSENARATEKGDRIVVDGGDGVRIEVQARLFQAIEKAGLVRRSGNSVTTGSEARAWISRYAARSTGLENDGHFRLTGKANGVQINPDESPLATVARMRDRDGLPWLSDAQIAAGERLRRDFTFAGLMPRISANWNLAAPAARRSGHAGGAADIPDSALDARSRVRDAVDAVGPELSGILLDTCCFLKGLETVERERGWPQRSAKLMLRTALSALERHYAPANRQPGQGGEIRHWGAEDYRPTLQAGDLR